MDNKVILVGCAGSGKDYLIDIFTSLGFKRGVSNTTRPKRVGEVDGLTYNYVSEESFIKSISEDKFLEHTTFNGWMYGTLKSDWESSDVFIMTPKGIKSLSKEDRNQCTIVYLDISEDIRYKRLSKRSDADSVDRRISADKKDFEGFTDYDLIVTNPEFNPHEIVWRVSGIKEYQLLSLQ